MDIRHFKEKAKAFSNSNNKSLSENLGLHTLEKGTILKTYYVLAFIEKRIGMQEKALRDLEALFVDEKLKNEFIKKFQQS